MNRPAMLNKKVMSRTEKIYAGLLAVLVFILFAFVVFNFAIGVSCFVVEVSGDSMNDTLKNEDLLYAKRNFQAERGDVIIVNVQKYHLFSQDTECIIKRLIAVEGDCVKCENGVVYLKRAGGEYTALEEDYAKGVTENFAECVVGEGEIFFLGDNREHSSDSRKVGCLKYSDIIGVVPQWAVSIRGFSTVWEGLRTHVATDS